MDMVYHIGMNGVKIVNKYATETNVKKNGNRLKIIKIMIN